MKSSAPHPAAVTAQAGLLCVGTITGERVPPGWFRWEIPVLSEAGTSIVVVLTERERAPRSYRVVQQDDDMQARVAKDALAEWLAARMDAES